MRWTLLARLRSAAIAALAAAIGIASASRASADIHALAIGFDAYESGQALKGAVADANDIAAVLRRRGVRDVVTMTDRRSTVRDFHRRWSEIVARARPGDLILFSFAGHGVWIPDKKNAPTPYGSQKGFLFPSFDPDARREELLRDEDLYDLFASTAAKGLRILFVVDACHAGSGIRAADPRQAGGAPRFQSFDSLDAGPVRPMRDPRPPIPSVATITAQLQEKKVIEYAIGGRPRGALSYAVARGLDGAADAVRPGSVTFRALWDFVRQAVEVRSENQQAPQKHVRAEDEAMPIFGPEPGSEPKLPSLPAVPEVAIHSLGSSAVVRDARFVADKAAADLIWDPGRRQLLDVAGILVSDFNGSRLQDAVDARRLLLFLTRASEQRGNLTVSVRRANGETPTTEEKGRFFVDGESIVLEATPRPLPYTTVLNISASGEVQILFPREDIEERPGRFDLKPLVVLPPFGGDFVVFVNSDVPLGLWQAFEPKGFKFNAGARETEEFLTRALADRRVRIGIQSVFTCRELKGNNQCDSMLSSAP